MATALSRKFARRKGLRSTASAFCKRIDDTIKDFTEEKRVTLIALQSTLMDTVKQLREFDDEICSALSPDDIKGDVT